jgi:urocanate hydratase
MPTATSTDLHAFQQAIRAGIPDELPPARPLDPSVPHAPRRKDILTPEEKKLALRNALRYFPTKHHATLAPEFARELQEHGRIYMYRFRPTYAIHARPIDHYPAQCRQAAAIMLMIQNNLDPAVAQHPHELITYGGNGAVFQNWAQYLLTMKYLAEMTEEQTLVMYSGHPLGLFPSHPDAPRVVVTNGMMIPNYSKPDDWERFNALGVTQYGQMTAGSYMYIGPQGIVHGTTITVLNACRMLKDPGTTGKLFVTAGLGGMSGAQPKAGNIAGVVTICAEVNPAAAHKRHAQGWVDDVIDDVDRAIDAAREWQQKGEAHNIAYLGNVVDLWERLVARKVHVDLGSDQTSLHNPWAGGYYPVGLTFDESNALMASDPAAFKARVQESLRRQVAAINTLADRGMYFFDYGNAFLLESKRAGADIAGNDGAEFRYPSYVEDIMGPLCFDHGFGPFRWVCTSGDPKDLETSDRIAGDVLEEMHRIAPEPALDPQRAAEQTRGGQPGPHPLRRQRGPHPHRAGLQRGDQGGHHQRAHRAGARPPRCERHRQPLPRDQQHPRWQPVHRRYGRAQLRGRCLPRRHLDQPAQRRRRGLGRGDQRRLRHGARRQRRQRPPPAQHAALGREQWHRPPRLGP